MTTTVKTCPISTWRSAAARPSPRPPAENPAVACPAAHQPGVPTTSLVEQIDTSVTDEPALADRDIRISIQSAATQTAAPLRIPVAKVKSSSHDRTGRSLQQHPGFPHGTTTTPESTTQPHSAQPSSIIQRVAMSTSLRAAPARTTPGIATRERDSLEVWRDDVRPRAARVATDVIRGLIYSVAACVRSGSRPGRVTDWRG